MRLLITFEDGPKNEARLYNFCRGGALEYAGDLVADIFFRTDGGVLAADDRRGANQGRGGVYQEGARRFAAGEDPRCALWRRPAFAGLSGRGVPNDRKST